ncbi:hypothetical protein [Algoriphagus boritolerans]
MAGIGEVPEPIEFMDDAPAALLPDMLVAGLLSTGAELPELGDAA